MKNFVNYSEDPENVNISQVWKTLNKICPKFEVTVQSAKNDYFGKYVTAPSELKKILAKEYNGRFRTRHVRPDLGS